MDITRRGFLKLLAATPIAIAVASFPKVVEALPQPVVQQSRGQLNVGAYPYEGIVFDFSTFSLFSTSARVNFDRPYAVPVLAGLQPLIPKIPERTQIEFSCYNITQGDYRSLQDLMYCEPDDGLPWKSLQHDVIVWYVHDGQYEKIAIARETLIESVTVDMSEAMGITVKMVPRHIEYLKDQS